MSLLSLLSTTSFSLKLDNCLDKRINNLDSELDSLDSQTDELDN